MSTVDLESQDSVDPESSEYDDDEDDNDYYYKCGDEDEGMASDKEEGPESFEFVIIDSSEAQEIFDSSDLARDFELLKKHIIVS